MVAPMQAKQPWMRLVNGLMNPLRINYSPGPLQRGLIYHDIACGTPMTAADSNTDFKLPTNIP